MSPLESLGINGFFFVQIIAFIIIYLMLKKFAFEPIGNALTARSERIAKGLDDARVAEEACGKAEAEAEKIEAAAQTEAQQIVAEARARADETAKNVAVDAEQEAQNIRARARAEAETERDTLLGEMRGQVAAIAMAAANKLIQADLTKQRQQKLVAEFFSQVPAEAKDLGEDVVAISAVPLTNAELAKVKKATGATAVTNTVDPSILGGLVIRAGSTVIDGSVASQLAGLSREIG